MWKFFLFLTTFPVWRAGWGRNIGDDNDKDHTETIEYGMVAYTNNGNLDYRMYFDIVMD